MNKSLELKFWYILNDSIVLCLQNRKCTHLWNIFKLNSLNKRMGQKLTSKLLFILQGSVATQLRCGGTSRFSNQLITNFPQNTPVKKV